ncbi:MAG: RNA 2',3'-cyclic phosphodiesterase [Deltaproteobacteria bacterium]|nr:RNA 2',3'-cyclic phosphodiesterase [Deltaproteobacteria bacterium]
MSIRAFLAFELPPEIREKVRQVSEELKGLKMDVRWVRPENIHLTVVFLGNVREGDISAMAREIEHVSCGFHPFELCLKGIGVFPESRRPRVLWVGYEGDIERMAVLREVLYERLMPFEIKDEKRQFRPHLTLGRFRNPGRRSTLPDDVIKQYEGLSSASFKASELVLFKSELRPQGPEYSKIDSWPMSAEPVCV